MAIESAVTTRMISKMKRVLKYIAIENENNIRGIALIFAFLLIDPWLLQSLIFFPKILWFNSQFSNFFDDLAKNHTASKINGVVGIKGRMIPINPSSVKSIPSTK